MDRITCIIFSAHIFSLLLQYQEFAGTRETDFYRFLYNRSKIKPSTQYLQKTLQSQNSITELAFKRSKSVNIDDRRSFYSAIKYPPTEEERIQGWLASSEASTSKRKTEIVTEEYTYVTDNVRKEQNQDKEKNEKHIQDKDSGEKKRKQSLWKLLEDTVHTKTIHEHRLSGLELLDTKQELISHQMTNACNTLAETKSQPMVISPKGHSTSESIQPSNKTSTVPAYKRDLLIKKSGQRKISDFFQRTS